MRAILLAGGLGTRLRPLTLRIPKPFLPIANVPLLLHQLERVKRAGATEAMLCLSHLPEAARECVRTLQSPLPLRMVWEDPPLGTGGAVRNAIEGSDGETVLVLNADAISDGDLSSLVDFHRERGAACTILGTRVEDSSPYGLLDLDADGRVRSFREKTPAAESVVGTINAGVYVLEPRLLSRIEEGKAVSIEREFFPAVVAAGEPVFARVHEGYWIDVGTPAAYLRVHRDIFEGTFRCPVATPSGRAHLGAESVVQDAVLGEGSVLGDHSRAGGESM